MRAKHNLTRLTAALLALALALCAAALPARAQTQNAEPDRSVLGGMAPKIELIEADPAALPPQDGSVTLRSYAAYAPGVVYDYLTDDQRAAYTAFLSVCDSVEAPAVGYFGRSITMSDLIVGVEAALADHPEVFWTGGSYMMYPSAVMGEDGYRKCTAVQLNEERISITTAAELAAAKAEFAAAADQVLAGVDAGGSQSEIALAVHDALAARVTYDYASRGTEAHAPHTAYNALVLGKAVCDGYSRAYLYLLRRFGIPSAMVVGTDIKHAWNLVAIDGVWYEIPD